MEIQIGLAPAPRAERWRCWIVPSRVRWALVPAVALVGFAAATAATYPSSDVTPPASFLGPLTTSDPPNALRVSQRTRLRITTARPCRPQPRRRELTCPRR